MTRHPNYYKKYFCFFFPPGIRMSGKNIIFNDKKIKKGNFYKEKKQSKIDDIDVNKILISKKEAYFAQKKSSKYFIGYNDDDIIRPLCITFPQMIGCVKCFNSNKT